MLFSFLLLTDVACGSSAPRTRRNDREDDYDEDEENSFPGKIQLVPIVQRDTKNRPEVAQKVRDIIKQMPANETDRIGKMLNSSYEKMQRDANEGDSAIRQKIHQNPITNESRLESPMLSIVASIVASALVFLSIL
ncbi:unnamed protein product [Caenorhabditis bovis]|uniref:Uncharacterized protein n=1 Tax=Caenorhabditis bovis TaxID=2654633 RepID=A0A8S1EFF0_9PELO|nr:unnamed protein product [Caenorhabditis bovis]